MNILQLNHFELEHSVCTITHCHEIKFEHSILYDTSSMMKSASFSCGPTILDSILVAYGCEALRATIEAKSIEMHECCTNVFC